MFISYQIICGVNREPSPNDNLRAISRCITLLLDIIAGHNLSHPPSHPWIGTLEPGLEGSMECTCMLYTFRAAYNLPIILFENHITSGTKTSIKDPKKTPKVI